MSDTSEILKWIREVDLKTLPYEINGIGWGPKISNGQETGEYCLIFNVDKKKSLEELSSNEIIPKHFNIKNVDYKTDVQESIVHEKFAFRDCHTISDTVEPVQTNRSRHRPLRAGSEANPSWDSYVSTLGTFVIDKSDGQIVALSNNHVFADSQVTAFYDTTNSFGGKNTSALSGFQPTGFWNTSIQNDYIGTCKRPVVIGNINPLLNGSNYIIDTSCDAAILKLSNYNLLDNTSLKPLGFDVNPPYDFATDAEIDSLLNQASPNFGAPLFRSGRTCGPVGFPGNTYSCGISAYQFLNTTVGTYNGYVSIFSNCFWVRGDVVAGRGGDSGSAFYALFDRNTPNPKWKLIGLLFAGPNASFPAYTIGCRITNIARDLNLAPWDGTTIPTLTSITNYQRSFSTNATIVLSGRTYYQLGRVY